MSFPTRNFSLSGSKYAPKTETGVSQGDTESFGESEELVYEERGKEYYFTSTLLGETTDTVPIGTTVTNRGSYTSHK